MTKGTVAAFEIIGTVVMIQADKAEELAVTATAMVVVVAQRTRTVSMTMAVLQGFATVRVLAIITEVSGTTSMRSKAPLVGAVTAAV